MHASPIYTPDYLVSSLICFFIEVTLRHHSRIWEFVFDVLNRFFFFYCMYRMPSLSEQLQEVRSRAEVCLYSGGRVVEVRTGVMAMANLPLPPCSKYHHIAAENMVIENSFGSNRKEVRQNMCTYNIHIRKYLRQTV